MAYLLPTKNLKKLINPFKELKIKPALLANYIETVDIFPKGDNGDIYRQIAYYICNEQEKVVDIALGDIEKDDIPEKMLKNNTAYLAAAFYLDKEYIAINFEGNLKTVKTFFGIDIEKMESKMVVEETIKTIDFNRVLKVSENWGSVDFIREALKNKNTDTIINNADVKVWENAELLTEFLNLREINKSLWEKLHISNRLLEKESFIKLLCEKPVALSTVWLYHYDKFYQKNENVKTEESINFMRQKLMMNNNFFNDIITLEENNDFEKTLQSMMEPVKPVERAHDKHIKNLLNQYILSDEKVLCELFKTTFSIPQIYNYCSDNIKNNANVLSHYIYYLHNDTTYDKHHAKDFFKEVKAEALMQEQVINQLTMYFSMDDFPAIKDAIVKSKALHKKPLINQIMSGMQDSYALLYEKLDKDLKEDRDIIDMCFNKNPVVFYSLPVEDRNNPKYILPFITKILKSNNVTWRLDIFQKINNNKTSLISLDKIYDWSDKKDIETLISCLPQLLEKAPKSWQENIELLKHSNNLRSIKVSEPILKDLFDKYAKEVFDKNAAYYEILPLALKEDKNIIIEYLVKQKSANIQPYVPLIPAKLWGNKDFYLRLLSNPDIGKNNKESIEKMLPKEFFKEQGFVLELLKNIDAKDISISVLNRAPEIKSFFEKNNIMIGNYSASVKKYLLDDTLNKTMKVNPVIKI